MASLVPCPGNRVMLLTREKEATQGRRERRYWTSIGATEDAAGRSFAAVRARRIPRTWH